MVTKETLEFFNGPIISGLATANAAGLPFFTRTYLVAGESGGKTVDVYIPEVMAARPLADLKENNKAAVVVGDVTNFKAQQFKGKVIQTAKATTAEIENLNKELQKLVPVLGEFFGPGAGEGWSRTIVDPALRLTIDLADVYEQTPKPGTGGRIS